MVFFFQAEDGIRDLVRSRGLGDVYKRQAEARAAQTRRRDAGFRRICSVATACLAVTPRPETVSYTHLTLPTSDLV